jgi:hypothetical protein
MTAVRKTFKGPCTSLKTRWKSDSNIPDSTTSHSEDAAKPDARYRSRAAKSIRQVAAYPPCARTRSDSSLNSSAIKPGDSWTSSGPMIVYIPCSILYQPLPWTSSPIVATSSSLFVGIIFNPKISNAQFLLKPGLEGGQSVSAGVVAI